MLRSSKAFVLMCHPWTLHFCPCCQSSKFEPTLLLPLRKCVPVTGQVRGQCGQAVIVPHLTKVPWCQHNHIVCTVTTVWKALLLGQSFPIYKALNVRKWKMACYMSCMLPNVSCCCSFNSFTHTQTHTHTLNLSSLMTSWWISYMFHLSQIG